MHRKREHSLDFIAQEDFVKALKVDDLKPRTNPKHYITNGCTTIDGMFSNKTIKKTYLCCCCCCRVSGR